MLHAQPAMIATGVVQQSWSIWFYSILWVLLVLSLGSAGLGLLGVRAFGKRWRGLAIFGAFASMFFAVGADSQARWTLVGIDVVVFMAAIFSRGYEPPVVQRSWLRKVLSGTVKTVVVASMIYGSVAIAFRPWHNRWGATDAEIGKLLPGDERFPIRDNFINHVISIDAPPEKVWPWLLQLGQDKSGFYSYDWLERAIGDDVHNRFELRPEWQNLKEGDLVHATQPGYMWGWIGANPGWTVLKLEPNRVMQLKYWGTFWLERRKDGGTRFGVRSHIGDVPFWAAPIEVFLFEPTHFIMEQRMLRTIKELSERGESRR